MRDLLEGAVDELGWPHGDWSDKRGCLRKEKVIGGVREPTSVAKGGEREGSEV